MLLLELLDKLLKKFNINIRHIINNSDNTYEDVKNDGYIILYEHYDEIIKDDRVFINELKKKCLKFNKYNRRIDTKKKWQEFNDLEDLMNNISNSHTRINEDIICDIADIQNIVSKEEYNFLIDYYNLGYEKTAEKYNISNNYSRRKASSLINKIREVINRD